MKICNIHPLRPICHSMCLKMKDNRKTTACLNIHCFIHNRHNFRMSYLPNVHNTMYITVYIYIPIVPHAYSYILLSPIRANVNYSSHLPWQLGMTV